MDLFGVAEVEICPCAARGASSCGASTTSRVTFSGPYAVPRGRTSVGISDGSSDGARAGHRAEAPCRPRRRGLLPQTDVKVALSTASVYPESTATAFEVAARPGYDGAEIMVWTDPVSQDLRRCAGSPTHHQVPCPSPCTPPAC